jgi:hypothetical protein
MGHNHPGVPDDLPPITLDTVRVTKVDALEQTAGLAVLAIAILVGCYFVAFNYNVVIAFSLAIGLTLPVTLSAFYRARVLATRNLLRGTDYLVTLSAVIGLSSAFDLQGQVRALNELRLSDAVQQSRDALQTVGHSGGSCAALDRRVDEAEQRVEMKGGDATQADRDLVKFWSSDLSACVIGNQLMLGEYLDSASKLEA